MINDTNRRDVLSAAANLRTAATNPSTQQLADWLAGRLALRKQHSPYTGPPPWHGLQDVLNALQADDLLVVQGASVPGSTSAPGTDGDLRVALTEHGLRELGR